MTPATSELVGRRLSVTQRLAGFLEGWRSMPLPEGVRRQTRRLLINAVAASAAGYDHPAIRRLRAWATDGVTSGKASVLWYGDRTAGDRAALVNGAMLEVLDFNETHLDAFVHPTAPVWPAVQAAAETAGAPLSAALTALALGVEVELAVATMLMPAHYERGFNPAVAAGAVGAAAGCAVVRDLDAERTAHALGLAALGGAGPLEALGSHVHAYRIGDAARSGFVAADLAARGFTAPPEAIEGAHGLLASVAERDAAKVSNVLGSLGRDPQTPGGPDWRMLGRVAFKRYPTETISQAPLDCTMELRERTPGTKRAQLTSLTFRVAPLVAEVNRSRRSRFPTPQDDQQARFDGSFCVATAWHRGRFTTAELDPATRTDSDVLAIRDAVRFVADATLGLDAASLEATFADGSRETAVVDAFKGSPANPMSDEELLAKLQVCAGRITNSNRIDAIADAIKEAGSADASDFRAEEFAALLVAHPPA